MDDLIEALTILRKYGNPEYPTCCSHDELIIADIDPEEVSQEDRDRLDALGFFVYDNNDGCYFRSFKFGSC